MEHKLVETFSNNSIITYYFVGFDDWRDFDEIMNIVNKIIKPNKSHCQGATDMNGFFEKDGLCVEVQYDEMIGNYLEFKGKKTEVNIGRVRKWAKIIFDNLMSNAVKDNG